METFRLTGLGVAAVTPFTPDKEIDFEALGRVLDHIMEGHADYIVVLGTTGETPTSLPGRKQAVREFAVTRTAGRIPLVLGMGELHPLADRGNPFDGPLRFFSHPLCDTFL